MAEALGTVKSGTYGVVDLFTEQRKYDKDKSKFFIWRERGHAALAHVLITKIAKVSVTDPEPKHFEDGYRKFEFVMTAAGSSSSASLQDQITLATADADQLQANDLLEVDAGANSIWTYIDPSTLVITYAARGSSSAYTREVIEVLSKGAPSGGNVVILVRRGVGATTPTTPPQIPTSTKLWHNGEASEDGGGSRVSFTQSPVVVNNYIQTFKVPYEITDITQKVDIFGENEWQRKARNARKDFARRLDRSFVSGRKDRRLGANNQYIWYTGGCDEWVPQDATHRINAGRPISQTYLNSALKDVFLTGSEEKYGVCGYGFMTKLSNAGADKLRYNEKLSADLGLDVSDFTSAGGGMLHLLPDYEMSQTGKDNEIYALDLAYLQYMYIEGMDIAIDKGKTGTGLQANDEDKTKHQIKGTIGLKRTFRDTHFQMYNFS